MSSVLLRDRRRPAPGGTSSGRDRRVEDGLQHRALGPGSRGGRPPSATSRRTSVLGTPAVDVVHRDVVAAEGAEAERQLRQVAGADHERRPPCWRGPSGSACARAPAGSGRSTLCAVLGVEADVPDVLLAGRPDVDLAQLARRPPGPGARAFASVRSVVPKPGMVTARMPCARQPQQVEGARAHEERERRVEPAREAEHHALARRCARAARPGPRSGWRRSPGSARRASAGSAGTNGCGSTRRTQAVRPAAPGWAASATRR